MGSNVSQSRKVRDGDNDNNKNLKKSKSKKTQAGETDKKCSVKNSHSSVRRNLDGKYLIDQDFFDLEMCRC